MFILERGRLLKEFPWQGNISVFLWNAGSQLHLWRVSILITWPCKSGILTQMTCRNLALEVEACSCLHWFEIEEAIGAGGKQAQF